MACPGPTPLPAAHSAARGPAVGGCGEAMMLICLLKGTQLTCISPFPLPCSRLVQSVQSSCVKSRPGKLGGMHLELHVEAGLSLSVLGHQGWASLLFSRGGLLEKLEGLWKRLPPHWVPSALHVHSLGGLAHGRPLPVSRHSARVSLGD